MESSTSTVFHAFCQVLLRDLKIHFRHRADLMNPLVFFVLVATLFPLGIGPESSILTIIGSGIIWVAALLATLLSLDSLFRSDFDDGSLEQIMLSPHPLYVLVMAKVLAHWLVSGLLLVILSPVLAVMFHLPTLAIPALVVTLLLGTPLLSLLGAIGSALTVGLKKGGVLVSLLILPLYIPILIFGTGGIDAAVNGMDWSGYLFWLGAMLMLGVTFAPFAISAGLRISVSG
ncbi:MAG: heme exporter protein CcmB [Endozoicomonadaceae bacterium]|nr:heme exporter protein CcmB [Endozoicomonadaceae bacterium]